MADLRTLTAAYLADRGLDPDLIVDAHGSMFGPLLDLIRHTAEQVVRGCTEVAQLAVALAGDVASLPAALAGGGPLVVARLTDLVHLWVAAVEVRAADGWVGSLLDALLAMAAERVARP